jgi:citrate synthase
MSDAVDGLSNPRNLMTSREACAALDVKRETLYAYVSRGLIRCVSQRGVKTRMYLAEDVARIAARSAARKGHTAVAAGALHWGEPVLDSSITSVDERGLRYRAVALRALIEAQTPFERVGDLLWQSPPDEPWRQPAAAPRSSPKRPLQRMIARTTALALSDEVARGSEARERGRARSLIWALVHEVARPHGARSIAETLARSVCPTVTRAEASRAIDVALVVSADHELNASTFAARIAAGAGAELAACVGAALFTFTGHKHGGMCERVEAMVDALPAGAAARRRWIRERLGRGEAMQGFGHPLYPKGDPRGIALMDLSREIAGETVMHEVDATVAELCGLRPTLDFGLVALARSLAAPDGTATALFALGRTAGWCAHVFEQRSSAHLLRPRARYVGP